MSIYPPAAKSQQFSKRLAKCMILLFIYISGWGYRWITLGFWSQLHFLMKCVVLVARNERVNHPVLNVTVCPQLLWVSKGEVTGVWPSWNDCGFLPHSRNLAYVALAATCWGSEWAEQRGAVVLKEALPRGRAPCAWHRAPQKVCLAPMRSNEGVLCFLKPSVQSPDEICMGH